MINFALFREEMKTNMRPGTRREKTITIKDKGGMFGMFNIQITKTRGNMKVTRLTGLPNKNTWTLHQTADKKFIGTGYGPLAYDLGIEYVTNYKNSGCVPAIGAGNGGNTIDSNKVWKYYYENRSDIKKEPYDAKYFDPEYPPKIWGSKDEYATPDTHPWLWTIYTKPLVLIPKFLNDGSLTIK